MKKLTLAILLSLISLNVYAENATLRCHGTEQGTNGQEDLFFYDGNAISMIGGGTEDMYVPFKGHAGNGKIFENRRYLITVSYDNVVVETKGVASHVYGNVRCGSTGE